MRVQRTLWPALLALAIPAWATGSAAPEAKPSNVLLVVIDDIGVDRIGAYGEHPEPGRTPNIDALARDGVLFRNVWSAPRCSPARALILSGQYGFRTGVGDNSQIGNARSGLPRSIETLPEALGSDVPSWAFGKWHLEGGMVPLNPVQQGFDVFSGTLFNLSVDLRGGDAYFLWNQTIVADTRDGRVILDQSVNDVYATTAVIDETLFAVRRLASPWFVYVALHAAHRPLHAPPDDLHTYDLEGDPRDTPVEHTLAMVEAVDTELARLLRELPPDTTVIFMGDNGTSGRATTSPFDPDHAKGTLFEGGINVPLIVRGPGVAEPGRECTALVNATDVFATVLELVDPVGPVDQEALQEAPPDSISLAPYLRDPDQAPLREFVFAEYFRPNGRGTNKNTHDRTIRDTRYKLITHLPEALDTLGALEGPDAGELGDLPPRQAGGIDELYDLLLDPFEQVNLLGGDLSDEEAAAYLLLQAKLAGLTGS